MKGSGMVDRDIQSVAVPRRAVFAWCLFDWANSAFPTVIATFVFAAYFAQGIAPDPVRGTEGWSHAMSISGILIAILSPICGALADRSGHLKPWIVAFSGMCMVASACLWFAAPDPSWFWPAILIVIVANVGFEVGTVFYNAMLPRLVPAERIGRISGWAWGLGYAGGLAALLLCLFGFVKADPAPFGLDKATAEHVRIVGPLVAVWFAAFAWPMLVFVPSAPPREHDGTPAVRAALTSIWQTIRDLRKHREIMKYLAAYLLYMDGLNTLFAFGGIYAAGTFKMTTEEVIVFGIALNVTAGLGAFGFAWLDDWIGAKPTIVIALCGLMGLGLPLLLIETKSLFWVLALGLGIFMGPAQAASRSLMARMAPEELRAEMFGLFALSGKVTSFLGPILVGLVAGLSGSQRIGMSPIFFLLAAGFLVLLTVKAPRR
jgi:UMF1 family MFS transporter